MHDQMPIVVFIPLAAIVWTAYIIMVVRERRRRIRKGNN